MSKVIDQLAARIFEQGVGTDEAINPFWQRQLENFRSRFAADGRLSVEAMYCLGYWEEELPGGQGNRDLASWERVWKACLKVDPEGLSKGESEHVGALVVLHRHNLIDQYLATLDRLRLVSSMSIARHYFYRRQLLAVRKEPSHVLEIGAGSGHFAWLAADAGLVRHYVIVDLPEMLLNSGGTLARRLPTATLHGREAPDLSAGGMHIWLLEPADIGLIPDRSIDIALNFNSFMEMDDEVRDQYLAQVYRTARPGAIFYNVNRLQRKMTRRDGSTFEGNPLLYPYRPTDHVLSWGPDEMQQSIRSRNFHPPGSFAISRLARLA